MTTPTPSNFIYDFIAEDLKSGRFHTVVTRFPPEPNGYLHIGHAKSICINFGAALKYGGKCNLRIDDTNPVKEDREYINAIQEDVRWLGFQWDGMYYASDYFEQLYEWAEQLIKKGKAYVDDLTAEQIAEMRGGLTAKTAQESPYRNRSVEENLDLFRRMRAGEFPDGAAHPARQDRSALAEHQPARPGHVPHPARHAPARRRQMVHLSDVRLGARPIGLHRGHHALALHAGVREPSAALRLVRRATRHLPSAADRVRAAQPHLHRDEQAQAACNW